MAIAGAPALQSSYSVPGGTSGQMTPSQQALFAAQATAGGNPYGQAPSPLDQQSAAQAVAAYPQQAPPTTPAQGDIMTPQMQAYVTQFQASQAAQQQAINAGLMQAMQGLGQRRDAAAGVVAAIPGQYKSIMNDAQAASKGPAAPAGQPTSPEAQAAVNANQTLINNSNAAIGTAGSQMQPLLNAAVAADYSKGATTLNDQHMQNQAAIAQQQEQFNAMQAGFAHDEAMARLNSSLSSANNPSSKSSVQGQEDFLLWEQAHGLLPTPSNPTTQQNDANAQKVGFADNAQYQQAQSGDYYAAVSKALATNSRVPLGNNGMTIHGDDRPGLLKTVAGTNINVLRALWENKLITQQEYMQATGQTASSGL